MSKRVNGNSWKELGREDVLLNASCTRGTVFGVGHMVKR